MDARQLQRGELVLHLSPKALELLAILIAERGRVVPRRELYDRLWPSTFVVEANLPVLIREIRSAIADEEHTTIRTVHGVGYAFAASVRDKGLAKHCAHIFLYGDKECPLNEGDNIVGREPSAEVFIPSKSVSRRHAVVRIEGQRATLTDLESKNGTFIDTKPLQQQSPLSDGNVIRFGAVQVIYRCLFPAGTTDTFG